MANQDDLCRTCGGGVFPGRQTTGCPDPFHGKRPVKKTFIVIGTGKHSHVEFTDLKLDSDLPAELRMLAMDWGMYPEGPEDMYDPPDSGDCQCDPTKLLARCLALQVDEALDWEHSGGGEIHVKRVS